MAIGIAFPFVPVARLAGLPPLAGCLIGAFVLFGAVMERTPTLQRFSGIGVTLLLFSTGLKWNEDRGCTNIHTGPINAGRSHTTESVP